MIGHEALTVRLGGIYALQSLDQDHGDLYHIEIMKLFAAYLRRGPSRLELNDDPSNGTAPFFEDSQAVLTAIGKRAPTRADFEGTARYLMDPWYSDLQRADFSEGNFSYVWFVRADMRGSDLRSANLSSVNFQETNLSNARFVDSNLSHANLVYANLSGAQFSYGNGHLPAKGLTRGQIDVARADPGDPPILAGVVDAITKRELVWKGTQ